MSIYTNAICGMRKYADDKQLSSALDQSVVSANRSIAKLLTPSMTPADLYKIKTVTPGLRHILGDPNASTKDKLQAAYRMMQYVGSPGTSVENIAKSALGDIKSGVKADLTRLHKKYTVLKGDAKARFNKFKNDLPGMYAEGKKQLGDFYDANKSAVWAGGLGALGGGTIGASVAKNKLLGGLVGAGVGAGVSLGALRIAKYLGYDI